MAASYYKSPPHPGALIRGEHMWKLNADLGAPATRRRPVSKWVAGMQIAREVATLLGYLAMAGCALAWMYWALWQEPSLGQPRDAQHIEERAQ